MRVLAILALFVPTAAGAEPVPYTQASTVSFRTLPTAVDPHPLNPHVRYVGGYELTGHGTAELTGLSDLQIVPDGDALKVEAISDWGATARFVLRPDGKGGLEDSTLEIDQLRGVDGQPFYNKYLGDAEDIAIDPATGARYVSFEGFQRIMRYAPPQTWRGVGEVLPLSGLPAFPANEGMEGLTFVHEAPTNGATGDSLLIGVEAGGYWRCGLATYACYAVAGPPTPGFLYNLTSLAVLDPADPARDHDILALYRYYDPITGPRNILRLLRLEGDRLVKVEDLLKIAPPLPYDNFEGVAAVKTASGYRLYLISDGLGDNTKPKILVFDWAL